MNKTDIIRASENNRVAFTQTLQNEKYELRGVFNSEALVLISIINELKTPLFVESGRARGHSTNLVAKHFSQSQLKIVSIDYEKNEDTAFSESYLSKYPIEFVYGDANKVITQHITDDCTIFIDGPKGDDALMLAAVLLKNKKVKAVLVHDLHKNTFHRNVAENIFGNYFFSDDADFVERFKDLDTNCWIEMEGTGDAPYVRHGTPISSYASTMGVFFNSDKPLVQPAYANYLKYLEQNKPTFKNAFIATVPHDSWLYKMVFFIHKKLR